MRFHYASLRRAEQAADGLLLALSTAGIPTTLTKGRDILARATGHASWHEIKLSLGHAPEPSAYDERLDLPQVRHRLMDQARAVSQASGLRIGPACYIAAAARITAHPAGPHKLSGLSAAPLTGPEMRRHQIEYRGTHPDLGPLVFRNGILEPFLCEGTLGAAVGLRDRILESRRTGLSTIRNGIFTRLFLPDPVGETKVYDDLITALHRVVWADVFGTIENEAYRQGEAVEGPTFEPRLVVPA